MNSESPAKRKCLRADCENDAGTLQCPTCLKLGIQDSFFCSQDCFKLAWVSDLSLGADMRILIVLSACPFPKLL
jgi:methionyl aminopeptidase